jgi:hypothetical protein
MVSTKRSAPLDETATGDSNSFNLNSETSRSDDSQAEADAQAQIEMDKELSLMGVKLREYWLKLNLQLKSINSRI